MNINYLEKPSEKKIYELLKQSLFLKAGKYYDINRNGKTYNRLITELSCMKDNRMVSDFMLVHLTCKYFEKENIKYIVGGNWGESFSLFLLGNSFINPLNRHYICPICRNACINKRRKNQPFFVHEDTYKICPQCKSKMVPSGMNLAFKPFETEIRILIDENAPFEVSCFSNCVNDIWKHLCGETIDIGQVDEQGIIVERDKNVKYVKQNRGDLFHNIFEECFDSQQSIENSNSRILEILDLVCDRKIEINGNVYYSLMDLEKELYEAYVDENTMNKVICAILENKLLSQEDYQILKKKNIIISEQMKSLYSFSYLYNIVLGMLEQKN